MNARSHLIAVLAVLAPAPVPALADPGVDRAWADRDSPGGLRHALSVLEAASQAGDADARTFERLVRLRFFVTNETVPEKDEDARMDGWKQCVADGLRGLARHGAAGGLPIRTAEDLDALRDRVEPGAVGILYWTAVCYGNTIPGFSIFKQMGAAKRFKRFVERSLALDESYFQAGPHRVLAEFLQKAPGIAGGDSDRARRHAEAAMRLFPRYAENPLCRAENLWEPKGDDRRWHADVDAALQAPDDLYPDAIPEQRAARERARRMKGQGR